MFKPILAACLLVAAPLRAEVSGVVVRAGELEGVDTGPMPPGQQERALMPGRTIGDLHYLNQNTTIEAKLCRRFGMTAWLTYGMRDPVLDAVEVHLHHPLLRRPDGATGDEDFFVTHPNGNDVTVAFTFDNAWEMVPGTWTWDLVVNNRTVVSQSFDVVAPTDPVDPASICQGPPTS